MEVSPKEEGEERRWTMFKCFEAAKSLYLNPALDSKVKATARGNSNRRLFPSSSLQHSFSEKKLVLSSRKAKGVASLKHSKSFLAQHDAALDSHRPKTRLSNPQWHQFISASSQQQTPVNGTQVSEGISPAIQMSGLGAFKQKSAHFNYKAKVPLKSVAKEKQSTPQ